MARKKVKPLNLDQITEDGIDPFSLPALEAIRYFEGKGLDPHWHWADATGDSHDQALTVAKMLDVELLRDVKDAVLEAIKNGEVKEDFSDKIFPLMEAKGWIGWKKTIDPQTGEEVESELGTPRRIELIYRQNLATAFEAARDEFTDEVKEELPLMRFVAVVDDDTSELCASLDGVTLSVDDEFWDQFSPPLHFNCRSSKLQVDKEFSDEIGGAKGRPDVPMKEWKNPRTGEKHMIPEGSVYGMGSRGKDKMAAMEAALKEREGDLFSE